MITRALRGLLLFAILATPLAAHGEDATAQARRYNLEAKKQFSLGNFSGAAALFKLAYEAKPVPEFLHNLGQCYKRMAALGDLEQALFYFESYLNNAPDSPARGDVEREIAELKRQIASLRQGGVATGRPPRAVAAPAAAVAAPPVGQAATSRESRPIYTRWWFWTAIGVAVVGGSVAAVAATTGGSSRMPGGPDGRFDAASFGSR